MNFRQPGRRREESAPDLTPLIDVVFLLLIFFLVTATFAQRDRSVVPVDLPDSATGEAPSEREQITLILRADGSVLLQRTGQQLEERLAPDALRQRLTTLHQEDPAAVLFLRGDRDVRYGEVMGLLDLAREVGFRRVYNVLQRREPGPAPEP
ncbi:MAG: biopolymer transporter ExbD [Deltaproteobacteria bacterium]|nr:MAG: biopolymer transporter ExbD [Deltaproteobacteria bacterium]